MTQTLTYNSQDTKKNIKKTNLIKKLILQKKGLKLVVVSSLLQVLKNFYLETPNSFILHGGIKNTNDVIQAFKETVEGVLFLSIQIGDVGIDLSFADEMILYNSNYDSDSVDQVVKRIFRTGMKKDKNIFSIIGNSSDLQVHLIQWKKTQISSYLQEVLQNSKELNVFNLKEDIHFFEIFKKLKSTEEFIEINKEDIF